MCFKWLLPLEAGYVEAEGIERTPNFKQEDIVSHVGIATGKLTYELKLTGDVFSCEFFLSAFFHVVCEFSDFGPYHVDFSRNGKFFLFGGEKGHLSILDWKRHKIVTEFQVFICDCRLSFPSGYFDNMFSNSGERNSERCHVSPQ